MLERLVGLEVIAILAGVDEHFAFCEALSQLLKRLAVVAVPDVVKAREVIAVRLEQRDVFPHVAVAGNAPVRTDIELIRRGAVQGRMTIREPGPCGSISSQADGTFR